MVKFPVLFFLFTFLMYHEQGFRDIKTLLRLFFSFIILHLTIYLNWSNKDSCTYHFVEKKFSLLDIVGGSCFVKKIFLKNFAKLAVKHLWQSLFLIKLLALGLQMYQKEALAQLFSFPFCKFLRTPFFIERLW